MDYTLGNDIAAINIGASDIIKGGDSDDIIHGMIGNDILYGDGWDDDLIGGTGSDKIFGGSGEDGIIGDDGIIKTSRNGISETLYGIVAQAEKDIYIPGGGKPSENVFTGAIVDITNFLKKTVELQQWDAVIGDANDVAYGGLGDDFIHGGDGNDALSGAEALQPFFDDTRAIAGNPFEYDPLTRQLDFYYAEDPRSKIDGFLLNFDTFDANGLIEDGKDQIFGDMGHDALFGGTGHDRLFGGLGDDYLQLDDNLDTNGGLNDRVDDARIPEVTGGAGDFAYGGGGLDVLIANTGYDRMFDWGGEFNSFIVPFARFGAPTINRLPSPDIQEFLINLSAAGGDDPALFGPSSELGLVTQHDPEWQDNHGAPRDPQPGNLTGQDHPFDSTGIRENDLLQAPLQTLHGSTPTGRGDGFITPPPRGIHIEKAINAKFSTNPTSAEDADSFANRVFLDVGSNVVWTYLVTNTSKDRAPLSQVEIIDRSIGVLDFKPDYVSGDKNRNNLLDANETWLFSSKNVFDYQATEGVYTNIATVSAVDPSGLVVANSDYNHHEGFTIVNPPIPELQIEKAINAENPLAPTVFEDADFSPVVLEIGSVVTWTYKLVNNGISPLDIISIVDDGGTPDDGSKNSLRDDFKPVFKGGDANNNGLLDSGEVWLYSSEGVADYNVVEGLYENTVTVEAISTVLNEIVIDTDINKHLGVKDPTVLFADIRVEKAINAGDPNNPSRFEDADTLEEAPYLEVGDDVLWTYQVFNEGEISLYISDLVDNYGTLLDVHDDFNPEAIIKAGFINVGDLNNNRLIDPGEIWLYSSVLQPYQVKAGEYVNEVSVTASDGFSGEVSDTDVNYHIGIETPQISIEKLIEAPGMAAPMDADSASGAVLPIGLPVTWIYEVTNLAGASISITTLVDDAGTLEQSDDFSIGNNGIAYISGDENNNNLLDENETWVFNSTQTYIVIEGQYTNIAKVAGVLSGDTSVIVMDNDSNNHYGVKGDPTDPAIRIEKAINATDPLNPTSLEDADTPTGPQLIVGSNVIWTYQLFNETSVALKVNEIVDDAGTLSLSDDFRPVAVLGADGFNLGDTNEDGLLNPDESWLYTSVGAQAVSGKPFKDYKVQEGQYINSVIVTAEVSGMNTPIVVTDTDLNHHFGQDYGEGLTPGFWKSNYANKYSASWPRDSEGELIYSPTQTLESVFDIPDELGFDSITLYEALTLKGGEAESLFRHAVAALLGATHTEVAYPYTAREVIDLTNAALDSGNSRKIESLKDQFDKYNSLESDLDQHNRSNNLFAASEPEGEINNEILDNATLGILAEEAIKQWNEYLISEQENPIQSGDVKFVVADLEGLTLGYSIGNTIYLDVNGAGHGWFVDNTAGLNEEYRQLGHTQESLVALKNSDAYGKMDLLSVVKHELGHILGKDHTDSGLMSSNLDVGERHLIESQQKIEKKNTVAWVSTQSAQSEMSDDIFQSIDNISQSTDGLVQKVNGFVQNEKVKHSYYDKLMGWFYTNPSLSEQKLQDNVQNNDFVFYNNEETKKRSDYLLDEIDTDYLSDFSDKHHDTNESTLNDEEYVSKKSELIDWSVLEK